jgi:hypothetical protein
MLERFEGGITLDRAEPVALPVLLFQLGGFAYVFALLLAGKPPLLGHDFAAFWAAAQLAAEGRAVESFNGDVIGPIQHAVMSVEGTLYWHYPPMFHLLILPLGGLGYAWAFIWFTLAGWAIWAFTVSRVAPDVPMHRKLAVLAAPIAWSTFVQGQNGALVALFLVMFLLALERERWAQAGFWAALLLIKPHLGVLLPLILIARGHWRVFPWGVLFGGAFCGLATWVFGFGYWRAFLANGDALWAAMHTGKLAHAQISAFAFAQNVGLPEFWGWVLQGGTAVMAAALTWAVWRSPQAGASLRMATVLVCSVMISPYAFYYDAPATAIALFLLFRDGMRSGFAAGERSVYLFFWIAPVLHLILTVDGRVFVLYPAFLLLMWQCFRRFRRLNAAEYMQRTAHALP